MFPKSFKVLWILVAAAAVSVLLCNITPITTALAWLLEYRCPKLPTSGVNPTGIIALGGTFVPADLAANEAEATAPNNRVIPAILLARRYPHARLIFSGGPNSPNEKQPDEAHQYGNLAVALGINPLRILYEDRSRNTYENAIFTRNLLHPKPGEHWILVTSAIHMPRAIGSFREAKFDVVPDPVNYLTTTSADNSWHFQRVAGVTARELYNAAVHEWIGLIGYRLTGKADALFPGPCR